MDQNQLSMAYGYWKAGKAEQEAVFQLAFQENPFQNNYIINCGLEMLIKYLDNSPFNKISQPFADEAFNKYLKNLKFTCSIDAIPEGTLVHAKEPILFIRGSVLQCQLLQTILINTLGTASLIATKASRICQAAEGDAVITFDATASHAAHIGGLEAPTTKGLMSHSWVMSFPNELEAFRAFSDIMQNQTVLLLDTYNTMHGIKNAITVGQELRRRKHDLPGVQLNSGNITKFSKKIRKLLDKSGFNNTKIIASGNLDEYAIIKLKSQKAAVDTWDVNINHSDQSLNMSYKLIAIQSDTMPWQSVSGMQQQIRRFYQAQKPIKDVIYDTESGISKIKHDTYQDLLIPIFRDGKLVYNNPGIHDIRAHALAEITNFTGSNIKKYDVIIDKKLIELQKQFR